MDKYRFKRLMNIFYLVVKFFGLGGVCGSIGVGADVVIFGGGLKYLSSDQVLFGSK